MVRKRIKRLLCGPLTAGRPHTLPCCADGGTLVRLATVALPVVAVIRKVVFVVLVWAAKTNPRALWECLVCGIEGRTQAGQGGRDEEGKNWQEGRSCTPAPDRHCGGGSRISIEKSAVVSCGLRLPILRNMSGKRSILSGALKMGKRRCYETVLSSETMVFQRQFRRGWLGSWREGVGYVSKWTPAPLTDSLALFF
jgi:hypothetical protein